MKKKAERLRKQSCKILSNKVNVTKEEQKEEQKQEQISERITIQEMNSNNQGKEFLKMTNM